MEVDPIISEIRRLREIRAMRFGFDIEAIARDAEQQDTTDDRVIVCRPPRPPAVSFRAVATAANCDNA